MDKLALLEAYVARRIKRPFYFIHGVDSDAVRLTLSDRYVQIHPGRQDEVAIEFRATFHGSGPDDAIKAGTFERLHKLLEQPPTSFLAMDIAVLPGKVETETPAEWPWPILRSVEYTLCAEENDTLALTDIMPVERTAQSGPTLRDLTASFGITRVRTGGHRRGRAA